MPNYSTITIADLHEVLEKIEGHLSKQEQIQQRGGTGRGPTDPFRAFNQLNSNLQRLARGDFRVLSDLPRYLVDLSRSFASNIPHIVEGVSSLGNLLNFLGSLIRGAGLVGDIANIKAIYDIPKLAKLGLPTNKSVDAFIDVFGKEFGTYMGMGDQDATLIAANSFLLEVFNTFGAKGLKRFLDTAKEADEALQMPAGSIPVEEMFDSAGNLLKITPSGKLEPVKEIFESVIEDAFADMDSSDIIHAFEDALAQRNLPDWMIPETVEPFIPLLEHRALPLGPFQNVAGPFYSDKQQEALANLLFQQDQATPTTQQQQEALANLLFQQDEKDARNNNTAALANKLFNQDLANDLFNADLANDLFNADMAGEAAGGAGAAGEAAAAGGGFLSTLGEFLAIPGVGEVLAVVAAVATAGGLLLGLPVIIKDFGEALLDYQKKFSEYSGELFEVFAKFEVFNIRESIKLGGALAPSAGKLEASLERLITTLNPYLAGILTVVNEIASFAADAITELIRFLENQLAPIIKAISGGTIDILALLEDFRNGAGDQKMTEYLDRVEDGYNKRVKDGRQGYQVPSGSFFPTPVLP